MRVLVTVQHPAHVHFYKHVLEELHRRGHETRVVALEKDVALDLLDEYGIDYDVVGTRGGGLARLAVSQLAVEYRIYRIAKTFDPDVVTAIGGVAAAHVASMVGAKSVVFTDTEHAGLSNAIAFPFADEVCTPDCYDAAVKGTHHRYPSYHELAYLHPNRFSPDPETFDRLPVDPDDTYVVLRRVSWEAAHDVGDEGLDGLADLVAEMEATGAEVLITAEGDVDGSLADRCVDIEPHLMHQLLAYADLFVGESGTMASESAVLGTPAVYVHSENPGLMQDLESYGLLFNYNDEDRNRRAMETALDVLRGDVSANWAARRDRLLADKCDATDVVVSRLLTAGRRADGHVETPRGSPLSTPQ